MRRRPPQNEEEENDENTNKVPRLKMTDQQVIVWCVSFVLYSDFYNELLDSLSCTFACEDASFVGSIHINTIIVLYVLVACFL